MNNQPRLSTDHRLPIRPNYSVPSQRLPDSNGTQKEDRSGKLIIGEGILVAGQIDSCKSIFVQGRLETTVECYVLKVSDNGEFVGGAIVKDADIYGKFDGKLTVKGCLTVRANGIVLGKVEYGELKIERGGIVSGDMKPSDLENSPDVSLFQRACFSDR